MDSLEILKENEKNENGISKFLKRFDYYRKLPQDITETTYLGAFSKHFRLKLNLNKKSLIFVLMFDGILCLFRDYEIYGSEFKI